MEDPITLAIKGPVRTAEASDWGGYPGLVVEVFTHDSSCRWILRVSQPDRVDLTALPILYGVVVACMVNGTNQKRTSRYFRLESQAETLTVGSAPYAEWS